MDLNKIATCLKELGYQKLTEIQRKSLIELSKGDRSLVVVAPTGSGKTEAAVFPIMLKTASQSKRAITAIYVTPLRALNRDIERRLKRIGTCFELDVAVRHGDTPSSIRRSIAKSPPHILITTPETFNYIIINEEIRPYLGNLEYVIIDEYRDMLESKRGLLLLTVLYLLESYLNKSLVKVALTATLQEEDKALKLISPGSALPVVMLKDPSTRDLELRVMVPACRTEVCKKILTHVDDEALAARLEKIVEKALEEKSVIVFTNTRSLAESLSTLLRKQIEELGLELKLDVHHGSLSRSHREKVETCFREKKLNMLVSTSSLELGIDIGHVEYVMQYMSPRQAARLIQRVGRSRHRLGDVSRGLIITSSNILHLLEALVIARRARNGLLEREVIIPKPLDVLAYAIALYTLLHSDGVPLDKLYNEVKRHPLYSDLSFEEFNEIVDYLLYTRIVRVKGENNVIIPTRKTKLYVYKTYMIPATRDVHVVDAGSGGKVGVLDEEYVVTNLDPDSVIVLAGRPWRVVSYDERERKLYVEPAKTSAEEVIIPHWEGENIPVEFSVAQEVGEVVKYIKEHGDLPEDLRELLILEEPIDCLRHVRELGDSENIYIDHLEEYGLVVVNVYGGSKVNALIKDLVKYTLKTSYPYIKVQAYSTPYAVYIQLAGIHVPGPVKGPVHAVYEVIKNLKTYANRSLLERIAKDSSAYLWRIYQVAQRFGAISPDSTYVSRKLLEAFSDTIIGKEALKEVFFRDYDIDSFIELAERVAEGKVNVVLRRYSKLQEHHITLLRYIETPLIKEWPSLDTNSFLERLLNRRVSVICLRCGYHREARAREIVELNEFSCPKCGLATLTLVKGDASRELELVKKLRRGEKLTPEEQKLRKDLVERAILLYRYGDKAVLALSALGVGTQEAIRIINRVLSGADLVTELYECEKRFLRVKKYLKEKGGTVSD
ncbi:MAG: DEAD/DEAH box helicase [Desulfurococcaceae archaeon]